MAPQTPRPRRRLAVLAALPLLLAGLPLAAGAEPEPDDVASPVSAAATTGEATEIVEVTVADQDAIAGLIEAGADVTEYTRPADGGLVVHVVATPAEQAVLRDLGYAVGEVVVSAAETEAVVAERDAAVRRVNQTFARMAETLTPLRAEWFESVGGQTYLGVEVKTSLGADSNVTLTVGFGGQTVTMDRFVDAGQYIYHTLFEPVAVDDVPAEVTVTSSGGASVTVPVVEWLGDPRPDPGPHYATGFVDHYMDPTELYDRIEALAAEFPELAEIVELPYQTNGYRRKAQAMIGAGATAFYVTSHDWGHEGGNDLRLETVNPGTANSPLSVGVTGGTVRVSLGTDAAGVPNSTAAQVVAAVNAAPAASALVTAATYRTTGGTGIAVAGAQDLSDGLDAPAGISREPFSVRAIRIGKVRDGSRTGVFAYSQEHAREWVTPLVALETAERLLRNYANDADTKKLVDDLDIFIVPSVNPDGAHYSFYDFNGQRKNLTNHCPATSGDPASANSWGVDLNRNFSVGSRFDGYSGASASCTSGNFSGPAELSEPEARNEVWLTEQYPNIRFAMNVHSYGGYFMWPPGAYVQNGRVPLPRPTLGEENYFWAASSHILSAVQDWRGTAVWPGRTGPVSDVLYSAAGNSADEHWYNRGIFGWDFEVGADLWDPVEREWDPQGFQPPFAEGYEQAMEFSNGLVGLLEVARAYGRDNRPPRTTLELTDAGVTFEATEPVTIHYTLDGSRPTYESPRVESSGLREGAAPIPLGAGSTRVHWFSVDAAGNVENRYDPLRPSSSYRKQTVRVG
ncbi:M14 family zinc carboxypeptidase [Jiangella alba]|uniref:Chitobiase/beta-hexosaminidase C-terminal domain-containing protein n=1 Tax=Jiangella alba TaxID=561176 RepID=A0A1H5PVH3_9ACTN|nr:M14 family zinc carboxypeptidase [Jiangella alba]SEF17211.1 Chitobiase/beta-hexosaminidase C-terminal domain-containing protein [Jiangella alba]